MCGESESQTLDSDLAIRLRSHYLLVFLQIPETLDSFSSRFRNLFPIPRTIKNDSHYSSSVSVLCPESCPLHSGHWHSMSVRQVLSLCQIWQKYCYIFATDFLFTQIDFIFHFNTFGIRRP